MVGGGIFALPLDWWVRAYFAMRMVVQSAFTLAKTVRDLHETSRMINRIEEARTEKLLSGRAAFMSPCLSRLSRLATRLARR
jgi:hypothetical protein